MVDKEAELKDLKRYKHAGYRNEGWLELWFKNMESLEVVGSSPVGSLTVRELYNELSVYDGLCKDKSTLIKLEKELPDGY